MRVISYLFVAFIISLLLSYFYIEDEVATLKGALIFQIQQNFENNCVYFFKEYSIKGEYKIGSTNGQLEGKDVTFETNYDFSKIKHRFVPIQGPELHIYNKTNVGLTYITLRCDNIEFEKNQKLNENILFKRYIGGLKHLLSEYSICVENYNESYNTISMVENKYFTISEESINGGGRPGLTYYETEHIFFREQHQQLVPKLKEFSYYKFFIFYTFIAFAICSVIVKLVTKHL